MPFIEVYGFDRSPSNKRQLSQRMTESLAKAFRISPAIISIYFLPITPEDYAHEGRLAPDEQSQRVFIKVHAFRREGDQRRAAVLAMTRDVTECFGTASRNVAIYFMDRKEDEVAHAGTLASD